MVSKKKVVGIVLGGMLLTGIGLAATGVLSSEAHVDKEKHGETEEWGQSFCFGYKNKRCVKVFPPTFVSQGTEFRQATVCVRLVGKDWKQKDKQGRYINKLFLSAGAFTEEGVGLTFGVGSSEYNLVWTETDDKVEELVGKGMSDWDAIELIDNNLFLRCEGWEIPEDGKSFTLVMQEKAGYDGLKGSRAKFQGIVTDDENFDDENFDEEN